MIQQIVENHLSSDGVPAGGTTYGPGLCISWQNGPLGRAEERAEPNGCFVETVIKAAIGRLDYYQSSQFACDENSEAIFYLGKAMESLESRTAKREARQVEGTLNVECAVPFAVGPE
jgi:hypothetical protein